ncbi:MAG: YihY/virulence factor BrkB family protein [Candidatus Promineifilaceae bacterium]|jgi:membrane protein
MKEFSKKLFYLVKKTVEQWQEDKVSRLAAALAFFAVLSIPSLMTLATTIAGQVIGERNAEQFVLSEAGTLAGPVARDALATVLETAKNLQGFTLSTLVSLAVLFFSASGVLVQLQDALDTVWDVQADPERGVMGTVKQRVFSFLVIVVIGILLIALLLANTFVSGLGESLNTLLPFSFGWARVLTAVASLVSYTVLIAVLFKTIPNVQISWRDVAIGAVVTALLLSLGLVGLNLYFQFSNPTSSYGAASSFMALLIWIYYSAQMLFLGAEFTEVYALRFGNHFRPDEGAIWDSSEHLVQAE